MIELTKAEGNTDATLETIADLFTYHSWNEVQIQQGTLVRKALETAYQTIVAQVPPSALRTRALDHIFDARMLANAAITHRGRF